MLYAAAETIATTARVGVRSDGRTGMTINAVHGPLQTTLVLLRDEHETVAVISSGFYVDHYPLANFLRDQVGDVLSLRRKQIFVFSTHNHSCVFLDKDRPFTTTFPDEKATLSEDGLTDEGRSLLADLKHAASELASKLVPVTVWWGVGHERRITYNRKGRRADGSTYFMREEDRLQLGQDFHGDIDDDAPVVVLKDERGKPVCALVQFNGHPVTAYHPEDPVVFGDYPQVACDDLSAALEGVPVGFLQGCAGDVNSKGLLSGKPAEEKVRDATNFGHCLGQTYVQCVSTLQPSERDDLAFGWKRLQLPFQELPRPRVLRAELSEMDDFLERCGRGDENTRTCVGLNFPSTLSPQYRSKLIEPCRRWAKWALDMCRDGRPEKIPESVALKVGTLRIGDVGIVGMPCEPFLGVGRQIKQAGALPLVVPCGYFMDNIGYVPDSPNVGDRDYPSAYYRYTGFYPPFHKTVGDVLVKGCVRLLEKTVGAAIPA